MFIVDTDVVSELRKAKSGKADPGVTAWAESVNASALFMSAVSLHELERGVLLLERRDPRQGDQLRRWLENAVVPAFADRVLPVDGRVARRAATLHVPDPAPLADSFIAATAQIHSMAVVTRNVSDFVRFTGLDVHNPWSEKNRAEQEQ